MINEFDVVGVFKGEKEFGRGNCAGGTKCSEFGLGIDLLMLGATILLFNTGACDVGQGRSSFGIFVEIIVRGKGIGTIFV